MTSKVKTMKSTDVKVTRKGPFGSITVEHSDGEEETLVTNLPEVQVGCEGKVIEMDGMRMFLRQPYKGD